MSPHSLLNLQEMCGDTRDPRYDSYFPTCISTEFEGFFVLLSLWSLEVGKERWRYKVGDDQV